MDKLKTFYRSFIKSITSPSYYRDIVKAPLSFSIKYILFLSYLVVLFHTLTAVGYLAFQLPKLPEHIETVKQRLNTFYPQDLIVTVENGTLSTNKQEPIHFNIPELQDEEIQHILTIDTSAQVENYPDYNSLILVTDEEYVYPENTPEGYSVVQIDETGEHMTISRENYDQLLGEVVPLLERLPSIAPYILIGIVLLVPFFGAVFEFIRNIFSVGLFTLITWLISQVLKIKLNYTKLFQMGLHAATVPVLITAILFLFGVSLPLIYLSSFLLWMVIILTQYKEVTK